MSTQTNFSADDRMYDLVASHPELIQIISRFGIGVGFAEKSIEQVCRQWNVDCPTFLAVVNFVVSGNSKLAAETPLSIDTLLQYLKQSHIYFLEYFLPGIRRKLLEGIRFRTTDVSFLILKFFDDYMAEVRRHMEYEENTVFKYVDTLVNGKPHNNYEISVYSSHHGQVSDKLSELKSIILRFCPESADVNLLNDALHDIYRCELELESHCMIEDNVFIPQIRLLEKKGGLK